MTHRWAPASLAIPLLLTACGSAGPAGPALSTASRAAATGTVTGILVMAGGPAGPGGQQPRARGIPGTVVFTGGSHQRITAQAGRSGRFAVSLPAGTYRVTARSPRIAGPGGAQQSQCTLPRPVTVTAGHRTAITLACAVP